MTKTETEAKHFVEGYQTAMHDIYLAQRDGGLEGVRQWLRDNYALATDSQRADLEAS